MKPTVEPSGHEISEVRVLRGSFVVAAGLMSAQLLGYLRQAVIGYLLGTGRDADALMVAMAPIELWWTVMSVTVIFGFVPKFTAAESENRYRLADLLRPTARIAAGFTLLCLIFSQPIVRLFAPGLDSETVTTAAGLLQVMAAAPLAVGASFVYTAFLYSHRKFVMGSFHHGVVNLVMVVLGLVLYSKWGAYALAFGYTAGAWVQLAAAHWHARKLIGAQQASSRGISVVELLAGPAPIMGQALAIELNTAVSRAYASTFGPGATSSFEFSYKVFRVPLALLVVPLSQSLLPELSSRLGSASERQAGLRVALRGAWLSALAAGVAMVVMMLLRKPIISLLFQRGAFAQASTDAVSTVLLGYMPVIVGRGVTDFLSRVFFSIGRARIPLLAGVIALVLNFCVCLFLPSEDLVLIGLGAVIGFFVGAIWNIFCFVKVRRDV